MPDTSGVAESGRFDMSPTVNEIIGRPAAILGDRPAVVDGTRIVTYSELGQRVRAVATAIDDMDTPRGSTMASLMCNSQQHLEAWFAIPSAGRVLCDLNTRLTVSELRYMVTDAGSSALLCDETTIAAAQQLLEGDCPVEKLIYVGPELPDGAIGYEDLANTSPRELDTPSGDDVAGIFYTGGTTGLPKGVLHTHRSVADNAKHLLIEHRFSSTDRYLHAAPMFHLADGSFSLALTWAGGCHYFLNGFSPTALAETVATHGINQLLLVPSMIAMLVGDPIVESTDWSCVDRLFYGASPMPAELQGRVAQAMGTELIQMYGFTEGGLVTGLGAEAHSQGLAGEVPWRDRLRSAGRALLGVSVSIRGDDGTDTPAGSVGEIHVRGSNIMAGYHDPLRESGDALDEHGWYASGDVGYLDEDGYLFIVDRAKDMVITGGENVYCPEVENVLTAHPDIAECAVVGVPDDTWGEKVHAFVTTTSPLTEDDLDDHCRQQLAGYKIPRTYTIDDKPLPRSAIGKVLKTELREPYWQGRDRQVN